MGVDSNNGTTAHLPLHIIRLEALLLVHVARLPSLELDLVHADRAARAHPLGDDPPKGHDPAPGEVVRRNDRAAGDLAGDARAAGRTRRPRWHCTRSGT